MWIIQLINHKTGNVVEYASLFDCNNPNDLETRVEYLKELKAIYCISYNHTVPQNEDDDSNFKGHITTIKIQYEPKIDCTQEQIIKEFRSMWQVIECGFNSKMRKKKH